MSNGVRAREADVERIQQMFPQIDRRSIMWNLQRDGGNVSATAERVLSGRGLEVVSAFDFCLFLIPRIRDKFSWDGEERGSTLLPTEILDLIRFQGLLA